MKEALLVGFALCWATDSYALRRPTPVSALWARSELVVIGEITGKESVFADDGSGNIETWWDVSVLDRVSGGLVEENLRLATPGGELAGLRLEVAHSPALQVDQRYLLLLTRRADGVGWRLVGGESGAISLQDDAAPDAVEAGRAP